MSGDRADQTPGPLEQASEGQAQPNAGLASLAHWSFIIGYVVPFASLIIPLVLLTTKGQQDEFVRENAKEALNMFITVFIAAVVFAILILVVVGIFLLIALGLYVLIFSIVAAIAEKESRFVRFHAFQSLLLHGAAFVAGIAFWVLGFVLAMVDLGAVSLLLWLLQMVVGVALLALAIFLMIKANGGEEFELPVIGPMAHQWA